MNRLLRICVLLFSFAITWQAAADVSVRGYYRSNGTYVQPHYRSPPNGTVTDNYSYRRNINPHTGSVGTNYYRHDLTSPGVRCEPVSGGNSPSYVEKPRFSAGVRARRRGDRGAPRASVLCLFGQLPSRYRQCNHCRCRSNDGDPSSRGAGGKAHGRALAGRLRSLSGQADRRHRLWNGRDAELAGQ
jgi:hypothetical protein